MKVVVLHSFKQMIAEASLMLVILHGVFDRLQITAGRVWLTRALVLAALLSSWAFFDFGHYGPWKLDQTDAKFSHFYYYVNRHDFYHYYMGAKYSPEIGYLDLYPCSLIVDRDNGSKYSRPTIHDQENYNKWPSVKSVMQDRARYEAKFTPERWAEFEKDALFFRDLMGTSRWQRALRDKGYNATPTWNMPAHIVTNALSVHSTLQRSLLLWLDYVLILSMFLMVWWAFGARTVLFCIAFFGINYMMNETHIKGSLLRLDWVAMIVMAICLVKKDCYKTAGAFMGYAAMSRIFPAIFMFGIGAKLVIDFVRTKKITWPYVRMCVSFGAMALVLFGLSLASEGGLKPGIEKWTQYQQLIRMHNDDVVQVRTGFKYVFLNTHERGEGLSATQFRVQKNDLFHERQVLWWIVQAAVLLASLYFVRNLEPYEALAYGFVPVYFLVAPTFYYYVMLVIPFFIFAPKLERFERALGLCLLFAASIAGYQMFRFMKLDFPLFYWNSLMYLAFCGYIMYTGFWARLKDGEAPQGEPPEAVPA